MSRIILAAGRRFGRFAVLLLVPPVAVIFTLWLSLLDHHPKWFIALAIIVLPLTTMTASFVVGILVAGVQRSKVTGVDRTEAPGLWSAWETVAGSRMAKRTTIIVSDEFNASIGFERVLFGLLGGRYILNVGIPLLAVADANAIAAILAHENAHMVNKDVNGMLRLVELDQTFDFVFSYAPPESTISGRILFSLLGLLSVALERETKRLSREAEIKADQQSASGGLTEEAARALLLIAAASEFLQDQVYDPLKLELIGAINPPAPPLKRVLDAAGRLSNPEVLNS